MYTKIHRPEKNNHLKSIRPQYLLPKSLFIFTMKASNNWGKKMNKANLNNYGTLPQLLHSWPFSPLLFPILNSAMQQKFKLFSTIITPFNCSCRTHFNTEIINWRLASSVLPTCTSKEPHQGRKVPIKYFERILILSSR